MSALNDRYKTRREMYDYFMQREHWMEATRLAFDTAPPMHNEDISVIVRMNELLKGAVIEHRPNAQRMDVLNKRNELEYVGIFDFAVNLNYRLNFNFKSQQTPQQMSLLFKCKEEWDFKGKQLIYQEAWLSALHRMLTESEELRVLWNTKKSYSLPKS